MGNVVAAVGFALLNVGTGFLISALFENTQLRRPMKYALGFLIAGAIYLLLVGGGAADVLRTAIGAPLETD